MPKKGHKAASRQNQLSQRRRRFRGRTRINQSGVLNDEIASRSNTDYSHNSGEAEGPEKSSTVAEKVPQHRGRHNVTAGEAQPPLRYEYLGVEVKRIGLITSLVVLILIILTFVLGG